MKMCWCCSTCRQSVFWIVCDCVWSTTLYALMHRTIRTVVYVVSQVPAVFMWLGIGDPALGSNVSLHNPHFRVRV